ncbi:MAG: hypothetical protein L7S62_02225 [Flavobacteriales bacterium]|nr:hypothetical protein [Flavobacteriales bacterium]
MNKMITLSPAHYDQAQSMRNFSGWIANRMDAKPQSPSKSWAQVLFMIGQEFGLDSEEYRSWLAMKSIVDQLPK